MHCHAFMKKYATEGINRVLCFSPNDNSRPYLDHMVALFGFENPPTGLLRGLVNVLVPLDVTQPPSFLILDDFIPRPTKNMWDFDLLASIKSSIRSTVFLLSLLSLLECMRERLPHYLMTGSWRAQKPDYFEGTLKYVL
jgi:hypothetical protein